MHVSVSTFIQLLKLKKTTVNGERKLLNVMPWETHIGVFWLKRSATLCAVRHAGARNVVLWEAHTVVPEIAIQCHRKLKTGPFRIFYTAPMGLLSRALGPRRQYHERPRLALLGFPIQCPKSRVGNS